MGDKGDMMGSVVAEVQEELRTFFETKANTNGNENENENEEEVLLGKLCGVVCDVGMKMERSRRLDQGDIAVQLAPVCARVKTNPVHGAKVISEFIMTHLNSLSADERKGKLVQKVACAGPYLNIFLSRPMMYKRVVEQVLEMGARYGFTEAWKGKRVLVEHTSSNPNAPLHIGNLRNVMIGAHTARLIESAGADVKQHFYVNDLGAQIGLTAFGYNRVYNLIKPTMKIDHWIGSMYAIMNTLVELQKVEVDIGKLADACDAGTEGADAFRDGLVAKASGADKKKGIEEYIGIFRELRDREGYEVLFKTVVQEMRDEKDIKKGGAMLNLAYERQDPEAIRIFRKMVIDCLSGVQETLETYNVRHDAFDFESELGWEGSNTAFLDIMKNTSYFVPQTQSNDKGVPEGAYLNMQQFIVDQKLPQGKKGYMKPYPNLYVLRPDGSTLYTFRDIVYSFKKAHQSDLILNVICSEQDLAQQKVSLAMYMMNPELLGRQYHLQYDLVKLKTGKMSGRRGRYLLADDLYAQLKEEIRKKMAQKYEERGDKVSQEFFDQVTHEVSTAAMKYALLACTCSTQISFDIAKITDFEDASAPFILYNSTRLSSLIRKFEGLVEKGVSKDLPDLSQIDWSVVDNHMEWEMLMEFVLGFPSLLKLAACPALPKPPQNPEFGVHKVCDFLNMFTRKLSSYYGPRGVRILPHRSQETITDEQQTALHARIYLCKAFRQVIDNGLDKLFIKPLRKM
ncbi:arginine--tRNA ligase [Chloropicon primus]|uniref:arginine--tRNA ligase n=1 Tax=Chloropicon primus TaxID=1764295 RepID=A0A5B8N0V1_9CHLO|nr:arginine--tRNA ligase [Chloropicon primus]UPR04742.1 arginine--tRNA ligase [Chloropicon primus]|mmetsp:Transcript_3884/g.11216  ORF Transcript_3884/g.11216 Transcript_3884/m.11216 type:complete len:739 (+) Transcript_3884:97-2313(+)|eukprot:QDZ25545.1 arginine--tRNA ligase [Chloropicon primus]